MEFLKEMARKSANDFKEIADDVWGELGDSSMIPKALKEISSSAGKYALASQLLMTMNFPDDADMFRNSFNATNKGPTGSKGFAKTPIGHLLDSVADISAHRNAAAIGVQGFADISQTSTIKDLGEVLPQVRNMAMKENK